LTRILHVTECYAGGVSRAINTVVDLTPQFEHHLLWSGDEAPSESFGFASVSELSSGFSARVRDVRLTVSRVKPDVVHAHSSWGGVYSRVWPIGSPVIYQPHCYKFDDPESSTIGRKFFRFAERALSRNASAVAVLSAHEDRLARSLDKRVPIYFVPNVPTLSPSTTTNLGDIEEIVMIGRVSRQKDPGFFAEVARNVRRALPSVSFRWIGDGTTLDREPLDREQIAVSGWLNAEDLTATLSRPVVYFHSARYEGFPLSVLDAAALRLPIVARAIPALEGTALRQVVTVQEAADALIAVCTNPSERELAVQGGQELIAVMNRTSQAEALKRMYSEVGARVAVS
jgi:glycosyltransferase involved in cell wall biosynthesis